ncbi:DUF4292 domain-containing protein [Flavobacteriaceae bacterium F08102]|nr:DUF4292 domain-containing protein [Flavobacteriaceae bacterium F08102]
MRNILLILILSLTLGSCKSKKDLTRTSENKSMSSRKLIKNHYDKAFDKKTINAKLKIKYTGKSSLPGVTASLRMEKDKTIWLSLSKFGIGFAKALITPNRVSYYEKLNRTYFDGDFTLLSKWLGTDLDYEKVQNILIGQAILDLKKDKYHLNKRQNDLVLTPQKGNPLYDILFIINPLNFKIKSQEIQQRDAARKLLIDYPVYSTFGTTIFPKEIYIAASDLYNTSTIDIDYKSVEFNKNLSFPFEIPKNYEPLELK